MSAVVKFVQKKLDGHLKKLEAVAKALKSYDAKAYDTLPDMIDAFKSLKIEVEEKVATTTNQLEAASGAAATATAAKAPSGIKTAMKQIKLFTDEIAAIMGCVATIGKIVALYIEIGLLIAAKITEIITTITSLQLKKLTEFLDGLKKDLAEAIAKAKADAIKKAKLFYYKNRLTSYLEAISNNRKWSTDWSTVKGEAEIRDKYRLAVANILELYAVIEAGNLTKETLEKFSAADVTKIKKIVEDNGYYNAPPPY